MSQTYIVFSGISLSLGGVLTTFGWLVFAVVDPDHKSHDRAYWSLLNAAIISGGVLMALGLPGFYLRQAQLAGPIGLAAFIILFVGIVVAYIAVHSIETATYPDVPSKMMRWVAIGAPAVFIGSLLMSYVTWQAKVYPSIAGPILALATFFGILTVIPGVPAWLGRNAASAAWTAVIAWLGILTLII